MRNPGYRRELRSGILKHLQWHGNLFVNKEIILQDSEERAKQKTTRKKMKRTPFLLLLYFSKRLKFMLLKNAYNHKVHY